MFDWWGKIVDTLVYGTWGMSICCTEDVKVFLQAHTIPWDDENNKSGCC